MNSANNQEVLGVDVPVQGLSGDTWVNAWLDTDNLADKQSPGPLKAGKFFVCISAPGNKKDEDDEDEVQIYGATVQEIRAMSQALASVADQIENL